MHNCTFPCTAAVKGCESGDTNSQDRHKASFENALHGMETKTAGTAHAMRTFKALPPFSLTKTPAREVPVLEPARGCLLPPPMGGTQEVHRVKPLHSFRWPFRKYDYSSRNITATKL